MLRTLDRGLTRLEERLIGTLLVTASFVLFANVVARYVFNAGFVWAEELVRYEIVWMVFIGGSVAARKGVHIGIDILVRVLHGRSRQMVSVGINALALSFCLAIVYYGTQMAMLTRSFGQVTPALQVPLWTVQIAIPLGTALMALRFLQHLVVALRGGHEEADLEMLG